MGYKMKKRILSIIIDFCIVQIIVFAIIVFFPVKNFSNIIIGIFFPLLLSCKDLIYKNKSFGKKRIGLEIITLDDKIPSRLVIFLRNVTVCIWPIEFLLIFLERERLGDRIFKTKVITK